MVNVHGWAEIYKLMGVHFYGKLTVYIVCSVAHLRRFRILKLVLKVIRETQRVQKHWSQQILSVFTEIYLILCIIFVPYTQLKGQNTLYPILSMPLKYFYFYIILGTQTQCKMVLDHMERIIKVKAGVLSKEDKNRTEPK